MVMPSKFSTAVTCCVLGGQCPSDGIVYDSHQFRYEVLPDFFKVSYGLSSIALQTLAVATLLRRVDCVCATVLASPPRSVNRVLSSAAHAVSAELQSLRQKLLASWPSTDAAVTEWADFTAQLWRVGSAVAAIASLFGLPPVSGGGTSSTKAVDGEGMQARKRRGACSCVFATSPSEACLCVCNLTAPLLVQRVLRACRSVSASSAASFWRVGSRVLATVCDEIYYWACNGAPLALKLLPVEQDVRRCVGCDACDVSIVSPAIAWVVHDFVPVVVRLAALRSGFMAARLREAGIVLGPPFTGTVSSHWPPSAVGLPRPSAVADEGQAIPFVLLGKGADSIAESIRTHCAPPPSAAFLRAHTMSHQAQHQPPIHSGRLHSGTLSCQQQGVTRNMWATRALRVLLPEVPAFVACDVVLRGEWGARSARLLPLGASDSEEDGDDPADAPTAQSANEAMEDADGGRGEQDFCGTLRHSVDSLREASLPNAITQLEDGLAALPSDVELPIASQAAGSLSAAVIAIHGVVNMKYMEYATFTVGVPGALAAALECCTFSSPHVVSVVDLLIDDVLSASWGTESGSALCSNIHLFFHRLTEGVRRSSSLKLLSFGVQPGVAVPSPAELSSSVSPLMSIVRTMALNFDVSEFSLLAEIFPARISDAYSAIARRVLLTGGALRCVGLTMRDVRAVAASCTPGVRSSVLKRCILILTTLLHVLNAFHHYVSGSALLPLRLFVSSVAANAFSSFYELSSAHQLSVHACLPRLFLESTSWCLCDELHCIPVSHSASENATHCVTAVTASLESMSHAASLRLEAVFRVTFLTASTIRRRLRGNDVDFLQAVKDLEAEVTSVIADFSVATERLYAASLGRLPLEGFLSQCKPFHVAQ